MRPLVPGVIPEAGSPEVIDFVGEPSYPESMNIGLDPLGSVGAPRSRIVSFANPS